MKCKLASSPTNSKLGVHPRDSDSNSSPKQLVTCSLHLPPITMSSSGSSSKQAKALQISRLLKRIYRHDNMADYIPNQDEYEKFRREKKEELNRRYNSPPTFHRQNKLVIDPIAIDCWSYQDKDNNMVWQRYKDNVAALSYDTIRTLKVLNRK